MIPNKVIITGYKRFLSTTVNLDRKLLAFVGPNEAGKSSFFQALLSVQNNEPYTKNELTKGNDFDSDKCVVRVEYLLTDTEIEKVEEYNGIGVPRFYCIWKTVSGKIYHEIIDEVKRNKKERFNTKELLIKTLENSRLRKYLDNNYLEEDDEKIYLRNILQDLLNDIDTDSENIDKNIFDLVSSIELILTESDIDVTKTSLKYVDLLLEQLQKFSEVEKTIHPNEKLINKLVLSRPEFIIFKDDERILKGSYALEELNNPTPALRNLINLSGIDLEVLVDSMETDDISERLILTENANKKIKKEFSDSWSQSKVYPQFIFEDDSINIQIRYIKKYTEISERSDGLKQYIALKAFLATKKSKTLPVLLIDEAEIHLHYAAQSDLVIEFEKLKIINSMIYTTHSAGCLPSDLGNGIRVVEPLYENGKDTGMSQINNSIWKNNGGFSPLLLAMGANIIAFTLARKALIAEGPSETILLPRILRESNEKDFINFQVAPGIASISKNNSKLFELEAAKVAYLVDGDEGGIKNKKKLINGGIEENKIIALPKGASIEDFINPVILANAIKREFKTSGQKIPEFDLAIIPKLNRINWFKNICKILPNKVKIAENIAKESSNQIIYDVEKKKGLIDLYNKIIRVVDN